MQTAPAGLWSARRRTRTPDGATRQPDEKAWKLDEKVERPDEMWSAPDARAQVLRKPLVSPLSLLGQLAQQPNLPDVQRRGGPELFPRFHHHLDYPT